MRKAHRRAAGAMHRITNATRQAGEGGPRGDCRRVGPQVEKF
jgi:hypothetical protein